MSLAPKFTRRIWEQTNKQTARQTNKKNKTKQTKKPFEQSFLPFHFSCSDSESKHSPVRVRRRWEGINKGAINKIALYPEINSDPMKEQPSRDRLLGAIKRWLLEYYNKFP